MDYSIPAQIYESSGHRIVQSYTVNRVLDPSAGPCETCNEPTVRLDVTQHVNHDGYEYDMHFDFIYAHADGQPGHSEGGYLRPLPRCPQCRTYGTVTVRMEAYGDTTSCSACGYRRFYDIGD